MALTQQQKAALAARMINHVAKMVEFRDELVTDPALADLTINEIAAQLTMWLKGLPGDSWDVRLPDPIIAKRTLGRTRVDGA